MPVFFFSVLKILLKHVFWYRQQLVFQFFFYVLNRSKKFSLYRCLQIWEEQKVSVAQVWWIRWLRHDYGFIFSQKLTYKHRCVSWCLIMVQNPWLFFPQFYAFLTNCCVQLAHNFKVVFLIDHMTLWQEFMIHQSKKTVSKSFSFDRTWRVFFRS